jgi:ATP-dependent phosphofructokinase / diphosphate-dependent phosphofructokinase
MQLKGNLIVCQSGGPTAVINASLVGVIEEALRHEEIEGIYGAVNGILGILNRSIVDLKREDPSVIRGLLTTPSAGLGSCRYRPKEEDLERIHDFLREYNIRYFFINGGNDSMDTGMRILITAAERKYELRVIGIPKTVDNDLLHTDHCPGFGSIGRWLAIATMDAGRDTEGIYTSDPIKIIETMGRDAGWVAATSALAKRTEQDAPHLIYLPEVAFRLPEFLDDVQKLYDARGYVLVVASEGLRGEQGRPVIESKRAVDMDSFGHIQPGGIGQYLADAVTRNLKIKARFDKPGTIQRSSMLCASTVDSREAYLAGKMAVRYAAQGKSGFMVTLERTRSRDYLVETGIVELEKVANQVRTFPEEFIDADHHFVTRSFLDYVTPLVGDLPCYERLRKYPVPKPGLTGDEGRSERG